MVQQSFKEVFVTNSPTLLADGATVESIAVGQIGILDAKTNLSETLPTYANQKAIKLVWGTENLSHLTYTSGVPNQNIYTKLIKGTKIKSWQGIKAVTTATTEKVAIGYSGSGTDSLTGERGVVRHVFVKLTGGPIDKKFSLQGVTKMYSVVDGVLGDGGTYSASAIATDLAAQINADKDINDFVTAAVLNSGAYYGVELTAKLQQRVLTEATFQYFPAYEQEAIHIQISEFDPNYNNDVEAAVNNWVVTKTRDYSTTKGSGAYVRKLEKEALSYHLRERSSDPVVREWEGYAFQADPAKFYDEFILEFEFSYKAGGWSENYTDSYKVHVFFETGEGDSFETAINGYVASIGLGLDAINLNP